MEMIQEDKDLLLRDLCARLPYMPKIHADDGLSTDGSGVCTLLGVNSNKRIVLLGLDFGGVYATYKEHLDNIKPYLRPMSSMTEEEKDNWRLICAMSGCDMDEVDANAAIDFLNANHLDYRGLIPRGLALSSPEGMY